MNENRGMIRQPYLDYLVPGRSYCVIKPFVDASRTRHLPGEKWKFMGYVPNGFAEATQIFVDANGNESSFGIDRNALTSNLGLENIREFIRDDV